MFTNHSGSPASFPSLLSNSHLWNTLHLELSYTTTTMNKTDKFSALWKMMVWFQGGACL
jgi:hypothetical protein